MATILDFPPDTAKPRARPGMTMKGSSCEIVLFPGVRYEYWEGAPKTKQRKKAIKRDTLEIE